MSVLNRRSFLGTSLAGLSTAAYFGTEAWIRHAKSEGSQPPTGPREFSPSTLFLTWQRDPTTTMTIQWVAAETPTDKSIHYQTLGGSVLEVAPTTTRPFQNTDLKVHRCELTGLTPGTEYQFQVAGLSTAYRFRTMPAKITNTFQWVSGGDSGIDGHAIATNMNAARQDPQFVLIAGDLAYDNGKSPETFLKFLENYNRYMVDSQRRLIPMVATLGNHEVDGGYKKPRTAAPQFFSMFDGFYQDTTYGVLDFGDYLSLVLLDTDHISPIAGEQTSWLERTLAARQDRPHLIVAGHVPAYPSFRDPAGKDDNLGTGEENRKYWCPLFEKYQVDLVLEHHDHTFKRTHPLTNGLYDKHGVLYLGDGSWGKIRPPKTPEQRPYLAAVNECYHMTVHRFEGEQRFHTAIEESGKVADVCMTVSKRPSRRG
ncbi:MAG: metallophosphoesterase family protein [Planctomycetes bacterium]|nr:metallophosphoesterase family protein [Planctomycetota bacterium]